MATKVGFQLESSLASKHLTDAEYIKGGYIVVSSLADRNALPIAADGQDGVIVVGSLVYVTAEGKGYRYTGADWQEESVTPTSHTHTLSEITDAGTAAGKNFTTSVTENDQDLVTSGAVYTAISTAVEQLPEPMIFKGSLGDGGTISTLPEAAASNEGFTYKVITAGTYAGQTAKIGDTFISAKTGSSTYEWVLIPSGDEPSGTVTSVGISVPTGLSVSGSPITTSGTIAVSLADGYSIPTTAKQAEWDDAYSKEHTHANKNILDNISAAYTIAEQTKLAGIAEGAEANVQSDWAQSDTEADDYIKNKPTKLTDFTNDGNFVQDASYVHTDNNYTAAEKTKLAGIAAGAEVNVQSDWAQSDASADDYIQNKPGIATTSTVGFVKSTTTGTVADHDYYVEVANDGTMKVNVPWTDTLPEYATAQDINNLFADSPELVAFEVGQTISSIKIDPTVENVTVDGQSVSLANYCRSLQLDDVLFSFYNTGTQTSSGSAGIANGNVIKAEFPYLNNQARQVYYVPEAMGPFDAAGWWDVIVEDEQPVSMDYVTELLTITVPTYTIANGDIGPTFAPLNSTVFGAVLAQ